MDYLGEILADVMDEVVRAQNGNNRMHSLHEGLAILQEEVFELQTEVYKNPRKHPGRNSLARKEAIQVAAMAVRLIYDVLS